MTSLRNAFAGAMRHAWLALLCLGLASASAYARDPVVLVHGNGDSPSDWANTYNKLISKGYASSQIIRPNWGNKSCVTCNAHYDYNVDIVRKAIATALGRSSTGKVDVIGHSMGVTMAAKAILVGGYAGKVDAFVGIAGALRGVNYCGTYPYHYPSAACGSLGFSKDNPFLLSIRNKRFGARMYSIKSYYDAVICNGWGGCFVDGTHTSNIWYRGASYTYNSLGHFGLQDYTTERQVSLIQ
jgi:triacylglycerol lipase